MKQLEACTSLRRGVTGAEYLRELTLKTHQAMGKGEMGMQLGDILEGEMIGLRDRMNTKEDTKESHLSSEQ